VKQIYITIRCLAEPYKHAKLIRVKARLGRMRAIELADLLDGSSLAYVHSPGANSPIGRCCICQGQVECTVSAVLDGVEIEPTEEEAAAEKAHREKKSERELRGQLGGCVEAMERYSDSPNAAAPPQEPSGSVAEKNI
jgi:hypothetical protein